MTVFYKIENNSKSGNNVSSNSLARFRAKHTQDQNNVILCNVLRYKSKHKLNS